MRSLIILFCCVALVGAARGEEFNNRRAAKKAARQQAAAQVQTQNAVTPKLKARTTTNVNTSSQLSQLKARHLNRTQRHDELNAVQTDNHVNANNTLTTRSGKIRRFDLQNSRRVEAVKFRSENRIVGAENWRGEHYNAFRNYRAEWHDHNWWRHHHNRIVFVFGGWYYWNSGWWYPAWGYEPNAYYAYDGPIYAYNDLPPDQVVANVQASLQAQGYYHGEVDGLLGPLTRAAIASYQQDHGLYVTSAIDQPTLNSLGYS